MECERQLEEAVKSECPNITCNTAIKIAQKWVNSDWTAKPTEGNMYRPNCTTLRSES